MRTEKMSEVKRHCAFDRCTCGPPLFLISSVGVRLNVKSGESEDQTASLSGSIDCVPGLKEIRSVLRAVQTAAFL